MVGVGGNKGVVGRKRVGEEDGAVEGIGRIRSEGVGREHGEEDDERVDPCVSEGEVFPSAKETANFPSF